MGAWFGLHAWMRHLDESAVAPFRTEIEGQLNAYCEASTAVSADAWFHEARPQKDAGALLNPWLTPDAQGALPVDSPLRIPAPVKQALDDGHWLSLETDLSSVDFGWMARLHEFDRWTPPGLSAPGDGPVTLFGPAQPHVIDLLNWASLRLRHGVQQGAPLEAARDARQLAWLAYRTETSLGAVIATSILGYEQEARASMDAPPAEWKPMRAEDSERIKAIAMAAPLFSLVAMAPETGKKARICGSPPVGRCIGLTEGIVLARVVEPYAREAYRDAYVALETDTDGCNTSLHPALWARGATLLDAQSTTNVDITLPALLTLLPEQASHRHIANHVLMKALPWRSALDGLKEAASPSAAVDLEP
ncbi:hypothetical protein [Myxococcus hansupus]|nr:hypothetical protein [Myxococcus hansupus]